MTLDPTLRTVLVALLAAVGIPVAFFFWKMPKATLTPAEKELSTFSNPPLVVLPPRPQASFSGQLSPVRISPPKPAEGKATPKGIPSAGGSPPSASRTAAKARLPNTFGGRHTVSMIYCAGSTKTAIVDGKVLHEGSPLGDDRIIKIEKTRVLLRSAGKDQWLEAK